MSKCVKQRFTSKTAAMTAAHATTRATLDAQKFGAYRCPTCRYPTGQRAWHWGHRRRFGMRRKW